MKSLHESILSSNGAGIKLSIDKWLVDNFGVNPDRYGKEWTYDEKTGHIQFFGGTNSTIYMQDIDDKSPIYTFDYFLASDNKGKKDITINISGDREFTIFKQMFGQVKELGESACGIDVIIYNVPKITTQDLPKINGKLTLSGCKDVWFTKGLPKAKQIILKDCKTILRPSGVDDMIEAIKFN